MAVTASRPTAGTAATLLAQGDQTGQLQGGDDFRNRSALLKNVTATAAIFLGPDNGVTSSNGFQWDPADGPLTLNLEPGEQLWGVVAAVSQVVHVLVQGR